MFEIARQFGAWIDGENLDEVRFSEDDFERFVNFMVAAEREACARVAENGNFLHDDSPEAKFGKACADAIRARKD